MDWALLAQATQQVEPATSTPAIVTIIGGALAAVGGLLGLFLKYLSARDKREDEQAKLTQANYLDSLDRQQSQYLVDAANTRQVFTDTIKQQGSDFTQALERERTHMRESIHSVRNAHQEAYGRGYVDGLKKADDRKAARNGDTAAGTA